MNPNSHKELEEAFKNEVAGEWWVVYQDKLYIEMIVRKCFYYYESRENKPDSKQAWKRAINSFLEKNLKSKEFIKPPRVELNQRIKHPDSKDVYQSIVPNRTPEEHKARLKWILTMMAEKGNLGIRMDEVDERVERMTANKQGEAAIVGALVGMIKDKAEEIQATEDEIPF